jgi:hypothetical protein
MGLTRKDAEHLTQAICNHSDVFLTRDEKSIIKHRAKIEARFPIKVRKPSESRCRNLTSVEIKSLAAYEK